jgi:hypothetical protein
MRAGDSILVSTIRAFLDVELAKLMPSDDGSAREKVFAIYAIFQKGISSSNRTNQLVTQTILEHMKDPSRLFIDAPRNSEIGQLSIDCEFRRQLLNYLQNLVPEKLRGNKEASFKKAQGKILEIERQFTRGNSPFYSQRNLGHRAVFASMLFFTGVLFEIIYAVTSNGPTLLVVGTIMILFASALGAHTLWIARRQKRDFKMFIYSEQSESSRLISEGNIPIDLLNTDLFSEKRLMSVAVGKISSAFLNEDVTLFLTEDSTIGPA